MAPIMIAVYVLTSSTKKSNKFWITLVLALMVVFFFKSGLFDIGKEKIENTEFSENARLADGPALVSQMPVSDLILGIQETTVEKYIRKKSLGLSLSHLDSYFVSDFWYVMVLYGIIGLVLHLLVYYRIVKTEESLFPYIVVLLIAQFTQSISFRSMYIFQMMCIWTYISYRKKQNNYNYV